MVQEKVDKANAAITRLEDEVKALTKAAGRSGFGGMSEEEVEKRAKSEGAKSTRLNFKSSCALAKRSRKSRLSSTKKDMSVDSDADGGFLVSPETSSEISTIVFESNPIRRLASVQSISTDALEMMYDGGEAGSGWVGETAARPSTSTPQLKKLSFPVHELYANPQATQKLLDDAAVNLESLACGQSF